MAYKKKSGRYVAAARRVFCAALVCCLVLGTALAPMAHAAQAEPSLALYWGHAQEAAQFRAEGMLPGDRVEKTYTVEVSYRGTVRLCFAVDVNADDAPLAQVLQCAVYVNGADTPLYEGLLADVPGELVWTLTSSGSTTEAVEYTIAAYLDTSVTGEYSGQSLDADFRWWVETDSTDDASSGSSSSSSSGSSSDGASGGTSAPSDAASSSSAAADGAGSAAGSGAPAGDTTGSEAVSSAASGSSSAAASTPAEDASGEGEQAPDDLEEIIEDETPRADGALAVPASAKRVGAVMGGVAVAAAAAVWWFILGKRRKSEGGDGHA
jgi:hypothetical protein